MLAFVKKTTYSMNSGVMSGESLKWSSWSGVVGTACDDLSTKYTISRRVCVPIIAMVASLVVLMIIHPPFACTPAEGFLTARLSAFRVVTWLLLVGIATAALTQMKLFQ